MSLYVDASAAAKLVVAESESHALATYLDNAPDEPVSSMLLETELRRMAIRLALPQETITAVIDRIELVEPDRAMFSQAGLLPGPASRSLDALHLATALRLDVSAVVAYDNRLADSAPAAGLTVVAPS